MQVSTGNSYDHLSKLQVISSEGDSTMSQPEIIPADDPIFPTDYEMVSGVIEKKGMVSVTTPSPFNAETKLYNELMAKACPGLTWTPLRTQTSSGSKGHPANAVGRMAVTT